MAVVKATEGFSLVLLSFCDPLQLFSKYKLSFYLKFITNKDKLTEMLHV